MAGRFHHTKNSLHPKLKFEIEKPETTSNGLSLSLIDFKVTISKDDRSSIEFYKTLARKPLGLKLGLTSNHQTMISLSSVSHTAKKLAVESCGSRLGLKTE